MTLEEDGIILSSPEKISDISNLPENPANGKLYWIANENKIVVFIDNNWIEVHPKEDLSINRILKMEKVINEQQEEIERLKKSLLEIAEQPKVKGVGGLMNNYNNLIVKAENAIKNNRSGL